MQKENARADRARIVRSEATKNPNVRIFKLSRPIAPFGGWFGRDSLKRILGPDEARDLIQVWNTKCLRIGDEASAALSALLPKEDPGSTGIVSVYFDGDTIILEKETRISWAGLEAVLAETLRYAARIDFRKLTDAERSRALPIVTTQMRY